MDTLMTVGGFVPLSYVFYGVIQNARQKRQLNWLGLLLAFAGVLLPVGLITYGVLSDQSELFLALAALSSAGVMVLFGLIAVIQDRRAGRPMNRSNGLMGVAAGLLIIAAVLIITQVLPLVTTTTSAAATTNTQFTVPSGMTLPTGQTAASTNTADAASAGTATDASAGTSETATVETMDVALPSAPAGFALPGAASADTAAAATDSGTETTVETMDAAVPAAPAGFGAPGTTTAGTDTTTNATTPEQVIGAEPAGEVVLTGAITENSATPQTTAASLSLDDFISGVLANIGEIELPALSATSTETSSAATADAAASADTAETAAAVAGECTAVVRNNLNLRAEASAGAELLTTIPYSTVLSPTEATEDGWWAVSYNGMTGWVSGDFLDFASACAVN